MNEVYKIQERIIFKDGGKSQWVSTIKNRKYKTIIALIQALEAHKRNNELIKYYYYKVEFRPIHFYPQ